MQEPYKLIEESSTTTIEYQADKDLLVAGHENFIDAALVRKLGSILIAILVHAQS